MKRSFALVVLICSVTTLLTAQNSWQSMMDDRTANFFDIQADFYLYYDSVMAGGTVIPKGTGIKQFKRWEYYWQSRVDENGNFPQEGMVLDEVRRYVSDNADRTYVTGTGDWQVVGPVALPANGTGQPNGNGRVNCIAFHPTEANTLYAGAPSGGFWKSLDNGATWTEYSAGLTRLGISSIVVHPSTPDVIYIGTGDRDGGDAPGYGVWRSTDGGANWSAYNTGMGNRTVYEILMHPSNPLILVASSNGRIHRSVDGGANWTMTYNGAENFKDLAFHPTDPNIVYAASSDYYRSDDNGVTWAQVTAGVPTGASRIALAVSAQQPTYVYLVAGDGGGLEGVYRSTDSGLNFSTRATTPNIFGYDVTGGSGSQAFYDCVAVGDPTDGAHLFMGGINVWESFDGGTNWSIVTHWVGTGGNPAVHADQHVLEYSPLNGDLYNGNDGGVYYSSDAGASWNDISSGLAIAQVYKIGVAQSVSDLVINGYQDNGTAISDQGVFTTEIGGDGMECIIDPLDENYMYGALYYGDVRRSTNRGASFGGITSGISESGGWVTPYTLDPNSASRMYIGMNNVWRTNDVKAGTPGWTQISSFAGGGTLTDMAVAPSNSDVMYVSRSGTSNFYRSDNATTGSPTWTDLEANLPASGTPGDIAIDPTDATHVYIVLGNNIYESTNSGTSWTDISGTLPNISLNTVVIDKDSPVEAMYVGNDAGVFYRDNTLADWETYSTGFPNLEVTELEIASNAADCNSLLFASTYGQGLWKSNLKDPGGLAPVACFEADHLDGCTGDVFLFTDKSAYTPTSWTWAIAPASFIYVASTNANSQNPQVQFTAAGSYDITLTATNGTGSDVVAKVGYITVSNASIATAFNEDFESIALCGTASDCATTVCDLTGSLWRNALNGTDDDIDFRVDEGGTPSTGTGPAVDYAPGTGTGNYIYTEASGCPGQEAVMVSECIDLDQTYELSFAYHMSGTDMGELHVDISVAGTWQNDVTTAIVGDQGVNWVVRTVDLSPYTGTSVKLRFRGITGSGFTSDIALDDILFTPTSATYYSQSNGSTADPIWSPTPVGAPGAVSWNSGTSMVVQNSHSVTTTGADVNNLTVELGGSLDLTSGTLQVHGNAISVDGAVTGASASELALLSALPVAFGGTGTMDLYDLTVATPGGTALTGSLDINGTLQLNDGDFDATAGTVTMTSDATRTGRLGPVAGSASYTGNMTMERYIPAGATNWRLLGSAITGRTVQNWQDDFFTAGYPGSQYPNFFDPPNSSNFWPSIRWYDEPDTGTGQNDGTLGVSSNNQALSQGQGFAVWCGDALGGTAPFMIDLGDAPPVIATAPIALPMTWTDTGDPFVDGWNLVSNPVPSAIAFDQIARGADVEDYVTFYNPANGNTAVYDISIGFGTNGATNTIQSSQGFYLKTIGPNVATTVDESDKINDNAGGIFGLVDPPPMLQMQISSAINSFSDEALVVFHTGAPALDSEDAVKYVFAHAAAPQLASAAPDGTELAINAYGTETNGISIPLKVNVGVTGTYTVELTEIGGLALTCVALHDLVTGTITPLNGYASYDFTVNANDDPTVARFMLRTTLPVADFTSNAPVAVGEDLAFNNSSVDAIEYNWDFGDGTTSTELEPTHAWASDGTYQVSLTATTGTCENTITQAITINSAALPLSVKAILQGAYDATTGLMSDALRSNNYLPTTEPYTAMGVTLTGGGGETTSQQVLGVAGNNAIVDWVYVELRDMNDPGVVVESRCGLLQRDGDIVDVNGTGPLAFGQAPGSYYVAVGHRNHLGAMTRTAIPLGTSTNALDLTQAPLFGDDAAVSISGTVPTVALWAGDVNTDEVIRYTGQNNDRDPILLAIGGVVPTNTITGYYNEDVNMDGTVRYTGSGNDRDIILQNIGGVVPTNTRLEQMP